MPDPMTPSHRVWQQKRYNKITTGNDIVKVAMHSALTPAVASTRATMTGNHNTGTHPGDSAKKYSCGAGACAAKQARPKARSSILPPPF